MQYAEDEAETEHKSMKNVRSAANSVLGLVGMMVFAAVCFSSTIPSSLRVVEQVNGSLTAVPATSALRNPVVAPHAPRFQAAGKLKARSTASRAARSINRKSAQTASALTGCKDYAPSDGEPTARGKKSTAGKAYDNSDNSKGKGPCNGEGLHAR